MDEFRKLITEVNNLIKESQSVSFIVDKISENLVKRIKQICNKILVVDKYGKYGINTYRTGFTESILDNNIFIDCIVIQGKNYECLKNYLTIEEIPENCFFVNRETKEECLRIIVYYVGNNIYMESNSDAIYHEVEHLYQHLLRKKNDKKYNFLDRDKLYDTGIKLMKSSSFYEQKIGILIYLSDIYEQDAFVQGLYGELKNNYSNSFIEYEKTSIRKVLYNYETSLKIIKKDYSKHKKEIDAILDKNNISYRRLIKNSEFGIKRFKSKIGKVLSYFIFNINEILSKPLFEEIIDDINNEWK